MPNVPPIDAPLRDKLAQLLFVRIGSNLPPVQTFEEEEHRAAKLLDALPLGGLIVFNGHWDHTPATIARLQRTSQYPLLVSGDLERGVGQQLRGYPLFPHAMAFDRLGPAAAEAVREFARLTGEATRAAGLHINFAPTTDVNSEPRNPIIATRAFGTIPHRVAELVAAFVEGAKDARMLSTAKHFPGHGDTHEDSHHASPSVAASRETLVERELPPFAAAIRAGVPLVMTAHVRYPTIDPADVPATYSSPIINGLLRDQLGFQGAVLTDSLLMEGAKVGTGHEGEIAVKALAAGVDILLDVMEPAETLDALERAVEAGALSELRIEEAFERVRRLKEFAFDAAPSPFDAVQNRRATAEQASVVARKATVIVKNDSHTLPLSPDRSLCALFVNPFTLPSNADPPNLRKELESRFPQLTYFELGAEPTAAQLKQAESAAAVANQLLVAFIVKPAAWHRFGLPPAIRTWLADLLGRRRGVAACLGAPQGLEPLSHAAASICTYSDVPASQAALVEKLVESV